jgi:hypothetical protein
MSTQQRSTVMLALLLAGCGIIKIEYPEDRKKHADQEKQPSNLAVDVDRRVYPETMKHLDAADEALGKKSFDQALELVRKGRKQLQAEYDAKGLKDVVVSEAEQRVSMRAMLFEGEALRGLGREVDALLSVGPRVFDSGLCKSGLKPRCDEHAEWLNKTFPNVARSSGYLQLAAIEHFGPGLNTVLMDVYEREIKARKGWLGLTLEPTAKKEGKDGTVILKVEGETSHDSYDDCNKVGSARIGGVDFDVERCRKQAYTAPRADFTIQVPAADVAELKGVKGERVFVIFETKSWKRTGNKYDVGAGRAAFVSAPRN